MHWRGCRLGRLHRHRGAPVRTALVVWVGLGDALLRLRPAEAEARGAEVVAEHVMTTVSGLLYAPLGEAAFGKVGEVEPRPDEAVERPNEGARDQPEVIGNAVKPRPRRGLALARQSNLLWPLIARPRGDWREQPHVVARDDEVVE